MESCPIVDETDFKRNFNNLLAENKLNINECLITGGKRKKIIGGETLSKLNIKRTIQILLLILSAIMVSQSSGGVKTITTGVIMILKGECGNTINKILNWTGMGNPMCVQYNNILDKILKTIKGDQDALTLLIGYVAVITGGIKMVDLNLDKIVDVCYSSISSEPDTAAATETTGGKSKRKNKKIKKNKKSRKVKKN